MLGERQGTRHTQDLAKYRTSFLGLLAQKQSCVSPGVEAGRIFFPRAARRLIHHRGTGEGRRGCTTRFLLVCMRRCRLRMQDREASRPSADEVDHVLRQAAPVLGKALCYLRLRYVSSKQAVGPRGEREQREVGVSASELESQSPLLATWQRCSTAYLLSQAGCGMYAGVGRSCSIRTKKNKAVCVSRNRIMFSQRFG